MGSQCTPLSRHMPLIHHLPQFTNPNVSVLLFGYYATWASSIHPLRLRIHSRLRLRFQRDCHGQRELLLFGHLG